MAVEKVVVTKSKLDNLAEIISSKSEEPIPLTIDEMSAAVLDLNLVNNQNNKTVTPTIDEQTVTSDEPYTGLDSVTVEAISPVRSQEDLSVNGPYVDVPKGWYPQSVWGQVGPGSLETPSFNRTNYTDHVVLTPKVNVSQSGFIWATSSTGTSVTISASDVTKGTKTINQNGTFDVTNYKNASVNVPAPTPTALTITPTTSQQDFSDGPYNPVTVSAINIQSLEVTPSSETQVFNAIEKQLLTKLTTSQGKNNINLSISNSTNPINIGDTIYVSGYLLQGSGSIKDISKTIVVSSDQTQSYYVSLNSSRRVNVTLFRVASGTYSLNIALEDNSGNLITNQLFYIKENPDFDNTNTVGVFKGTKIADGYLPVTVNPIPSEYIIPEGTLEVTQNGTVDVTQYASATVSVPSSAPTLQSKTVTPTESQQVITADTDYDGLDEVTVSAISSTYVGSRITRRSSTDLSALGATVTAPAGYYAEDSSKSVQSGSVTVGAEYDTDHPSLITVRADISPGYLSGGQYQTKVISDILPIKTATTITPSETVQTAVEQYKWTTGAVTVNPIPSEYIIPTGELEITTNGTSDVTNYASVDVNVQPTLQSKTITPTESQQTVSPDSGYDALSSVTVDAISNTYVGSGIEQRDNTDLTASGSVVTVPAGYYPTQASKAVSSGSATVPATIMGGSGATVGRNSSGVISLIKTVSITPTVTPGYISTGTAGDSQIVLSTQGTVVRGTTYTPTTSDQTIFNSGIHYFEGAQKVAGDSDLIAENIKKDVDIFGVTGTYEGTVINNQDKSFTPDETGSIITPDEGYTGLGSVTVDAIPSTYVGSGITRRSSSDLTAPLATVNVPAGYYAEDASKTISNGSVTVTTAKGNVVSNSVKVFGRVNYTQGFISSGSQDDSTGIIIYASDLVSGNKAITQNGTGIDVTKYATVSVNIQPTLQSKTVTPTESSQTIAPDTGYDALSSVTVDAISSTYVGSGIVRDPEMTSDAFNHSLDVTANSGYYTQDQIYTVNAAEFDTAAAIYSGRSDQFIITKTITNPGYMDSNISIAISPNEVEDLNVLSTTSIVPTKSTQNVATYGDFVLGDITVAPIPDEYIIPTLQSKTVTPTESSQTIAPDTGYDGMDEVTVNAISSSYVGSGIDRRSSSDLTGDYGASAAGKYTVTAPSGYYESNATYSLTSKGASNITTSTSGGNLTVAWEQGFYGGGGKTIATVKDSGDLAVSGATVTVPAGYYATAASASVASGSASTPATSITANPTISVSSSGLITASVSASQNVTPTVSAGYVSSGTAGTVSVSGSKTQQLTTKAAATITPGTTNQTIAAGTYLTGTQTIAGDADLVAGNIKAGVQIFGVTGNLSFITYYTGSSDPSSSLGSNGDIYLKVA